VLGKEDVKGVSRFEAQLGHPKLAAFTHPLLRLGLLVAHPHANDYVPYRA
jgi:hypothetical protein